MVCVFKVEVISYSYLLMLSNVYKYYVIIMKELIMWVIITKPKDQKLGYGNTNVDDSK